VVLDQQHGESQLDEVAQVPGDLARQNRIDPRHGLVEQDQSRVRHEHAADLQQLLLSAGQAGCRVVEHAHEVQPARNVVGGLRKLMLAPLRGACTRERLPGPLARLLVPVQEQVLVHAEPWKPARDLKSAHQARVGDAIRSPTRDVAAVEHDLSGVGRHDARDAIEQRGLAAPFGPITPVMR
jgi:hypothetical protein